MHRRRIERGALHLHALGPRALAEMLIESGDLLHAGCEVDRLLTVYGRVSPEMVRAARADRMRAVEREHPGATK